MSERQYIAHIHHCSMLCKTAQPFRSPTTSHVVGLISREGGDVDDVPHSEVRGRDCKLTYEDARIMATGKSFFTPACLMATAFEQNAQ